MKDHISQGGIKGCYLQAPQRFFNEQLNKTCRVVGFGLSLAPETVLSNIGSSPNFVSNIN